MYITKPTRTSKNGKTYQSVLLRESYREDGKVKKRTIANLTHCQPDEIAAIEFALRHKGNLSALKAGASSLELREGRSVGAVWTAAQVAKRRGLEKALGAGWQGRLAMWQVLARVIDPGSRLSSVRLARAHAAADVLGLERGFDENDLYDNLGWLAENQEAIEPRLFRQRRGGAKPDLFLYDVTSTYL